MAAAPCSLPELSDLYREPIAGLGFEELDYTITFDAVCLSLSASVVHVVVAPLLAYCEGAIPSPAVEELRANVSASIARLCDTGAEQG